MSKRKMVSEWERSECAFPYLLVGEHPDRVLITPRQARLFAAAVWRWRGRVLQPRPEEPQNLAVAEYAERLADGLSDDRIPGHLVAAPLYPDPYAAARVMAQGTTMEHYPIMELLREVVGNPYHPGLPALRAQAAQWRVLNDRAVERLAEAIYRERAVEDLPLLADALDDAGCSDARVLRHLRGEHPCYFCHKFSRLCSVCNGTSWRKLTQPHVLGCWVLDLASGKT